MNLADIRKKAREERESENTPSAPEQTQPAKESEPGPPVPECLPAEDTVPAGPVESVPCLIPAAHPDIFDPVAVLVAGRQAAAGFAGELTQVSESSLSPDATATRKYLCFRVAAEEYAVSLMDIKEIIKPRETTEIPHVPAFVKGIISLRGMIVPILDMRLRLGFPPSSDTAKDRFVIVKRGEGFCGLLVDEVYQVINLDQQPIERPPTVLEGTDREFVKGIGRKDENIYILMDLEKVMDISLQ
ncbi:MAG TPA: chemotaxis protein CheW [Geobacteraceae bacterium]|nr:chemotaxis protein CheW [Geobacteraceae bacterium]